MKTVFYMKYALTIGILELEVLQMASIRLTNETKNYFVLCNGDKLEANP